jgi:hypothetical protein
MRAEAATSWVVKRRWVVGARREKSRICLIVRLNDYKDYDKFPDQEISALNAGAIGVTAPLSTSLHFWES